MGLSALEKLLGGEDDPGSPNAWHGHVYHRNEGDGPWWLSAEWSLAATWRGRYHRLLKGWWTLGPKHTRDSCEIEAAIGGEDSMLQVGAAVPKVGRAYVGVRLPRKLVDPWIYERREFAIKPLYLGDLLWVHFAYDDRMADMHDFYVRKGDTPDCATCGHMFAFHTDPVRVAPYAVKSLDDVERLTKVIPNPEHRCVTYAQINHGSEPCSCTGYVPAKPSVNRAQLWPGWEWKLRSAPVKDRLLGPTVHESKPRQGRGINVVWVDGKPTGERAVVPMPEGNYPCRVVLTEDTWERARWPFSRRRVLRAHIDMDVPIPFPGKGENSWDLDDDASYSMTCPAATVSEAVYAMAESALSRRERYASRGWVPTEGWPKGIQRV